MKRIGFVLLAALVAFSTLGCKGKSYVLSGTEPQFTASVTEEKDADGKKVAYFALNDYRVAFGSKKDAIAYFEQFKKRYDDAEAESRPSIINGELEGFGLHVVKNVGDIWYVDLNTEPHYAEAGVSYSSMSTDELLDEYEHKTREFMSLMSELSERSFTTKQERRFERILEDLADEFDDWF